MSAPIQGQQYFFYSPETDAQARPYVSQDMSAFQASMPIYPQQQQQQQPVFHPQLAPKHPMHSQMSLTPIASPQPTHIKPSIMIQQQHGSPALLALDTRFDFYSFPSTPPLSSAASSISSPPSTCGMAMTPVNGSFLPLDNMEGVKEGCESEVHAEILANPDWHRSDSPPLTPGMIFFSAFLFALFLLCGTTRAKNTQRDIVIFSHVKKFTMMKKECLEISSSGCID